jgi:uncharacterized protein
VARDAPSIEAYGEGGFRLSGQRHEGSLLILRDRAQAWPVGSMTELSSAAFDPILEVGRSGVELVLLGTGVRNALPSREVRERLRLAGLGLEFMDTPAAAKLYNLLTSEGRRIAAALIAI